MGPGLSPPVYFTQATIQLPGGDGAELFCKSNMACSTRAVGNRWVPPPSPCPCKGSASKSQGFVLILLKEEKDLREGHE